MQWILLLALFLKCNKNEPVISLNDTAHNNAIHSRLTLSDKVGDIVNHPAFKGFGEMLLPGKTIHLIITLLLETSVTVEYSLTSYS